MSYAVEDGVGNLIVRDRKKGRLVAGWSRYHQPLDWHSDFSWILIQLHQSQYCLQDAL